MGTMPDLILFLVIALFNLVALLGINLCLARFMRKRLSRHTVSWHCNKYANHTTYVLTIGDAVVRWTYVQPKHPSDNGRLSKGAR